MKEDTAIKQLLDSLYAAEQLGLRQMNIWDVIRHIKKFQQAELRNMQDCFFGGWNFKDKRICSEKNSDDYIQENYTYYL